MKVILVPLSGLSRDTSALEAAYAVAAKFRAHVDCLHVRPDPRLVVASTTAGMETGLGVGVFPAELWEVMVQADRRRARRAHDMFEAFCSKHKISAAASPVGVTASYREVEGGERNITANARYADLVVFANESILDQTSLDATGDVIVGCGKPILLAPPTSYDFSPNVIAIAWKETAEAARAVTAAMPILHQATKVIVLTAVEGSQNTEDTLRSAERLAALLKANGVAAHVAEVPSAHKSAPEATIDRALALNADLLVMGAYGHNRMREFLFGGFTKHVLHEPKLHVLMAH